MTLIPIAKAGSSSVDAERVQIVDGSGVQITSFGGGTQYADGAAAATPTGTQVTWNESGTQRAVSLTKALPVQPGTGATFPVSAASLPLPALAATSTKQSDGSQKSQIVDGSGNVIAATSNALNVHIASGSSAGTEYTEDAAAAANPAGPMTMAVRADSLAGVTTTDGDNIAARATDKGELYVKHADSIAVTSATLATSAKQDSEIALLTTIDTDTGGIATSTASIDTKTPALGQALAAASVPVVLTAAQITTLTPVSTVTANAGTNLNTSALALETTATSIKTAVEILDNAIAGTEMQVDVVAALPAGTNNIGDVDIASGTITTVTALTGGGIAHDGADSGNPIKVGARATNVDIAAVANNDRSDLVTTLTGKLITHPWSNPENFVSGAITSAMTGTTSTSLIAAPAAGLRNYITHIVVSNAHATVGTDVAIQDGSGGTTLYTIPAAAVYGGASIAFPVPLRQPTTATAIYCANVTTGASTKVSASGYKAA